LLGAVSDAAGIGRVDADYLGYFHRLFF